MPSSTSGAISPTSPGITFAVYSDGKRSERLFPFDLVHRIIPRAEWDRLEHSLAPRVVALNLFLQDVYGPQRILKDRKIPPPLVLSCRHFCRPVVGLCEIAAGPVEPPPPAGAPQQQQ